MPRNMSEPTSVLQVYEHRSHLVAAEEMTAIFLIPLDRDLLRSDSVAGLPPGSRFEVAISRDTPPPPSSSYNGGTYSKTLKIYSGPLKI